MQFRRAALRAAAVVLAFGSLVAGAQAQDWPTRPVKFVVPFAAGGATDVVARMVGAKLQEKWGQAVYVENRLGAGGSIGADVVAKSQPDGYTLLFHSGAIVINAKLFRKLPYDTDRDLVPIMNVASGPMLVVVSDKSRYRTLRDLLAAAKEKPGRLNFGSAGVGSQVHMAGEALAYVAGVDVTHVPYKGEALAYTDILAGQLDFVVGNFAPAAALVGPGRLRALAVTGKTRAQQLPDVPTAAEAGLPALDNAGWFGLFAPAGTPKEVLAKIQRDVASVLQGTEIKARLYVQGMKPVGNTPAEFAKSLKAESEQWAAVIKQRKLQAN